MHHLSLTDAKPLELTSLANGDVFIRNTADGHGHETGVVFSDRGILLLSGPERFVAFQRDAFDMTPVLACPVWKDLVLRVPQASSSQHGQSAKAGRVVMDGQGAHLSFRWRGSDGRPGGFSAVSLETWTHGSVSTGLALDAWSLVRVDAWGRDIVLVNGPDAAGA